MKRGNFQALFAEHLPGGNSLFPVSPGTLYIQLPFKFRSLVYCE